MASDSVALQEKLEELLNPRYRRRLLDRGLARGLVWEEGELPSDAQTVAPSLTEDLLDYAQAILSMALRLREQDAENSVLERAFVVAGEAIEAAVHRGKSGDTEGFHRVNAAVAFHLARYSARAFSILPSDSESLNWSPTEQVLVYLLRRKFNELHAAFSGWLLNEENHDDAIADRLATDDEFERDDAIHLVLVTSFMRGIALFDHALATGYVESAKQAKELLFLTAKSASDLHAVHHWWTALLTAHLIDELWSLSFHQRLPVLPEGDDKAHGRWNELRADYIYRLRASSRAAIELWPSQLTAAARAVDLLDDLVVALPTSSGKTRIAELCILRCLANRHRVIYITPLRALSAQVERDLAETFVPLGYHVTSLYGSAGIQSGDSESLGKGQIVVATPEKLDFALRNDAAIIDDVGLIVFDEGHMLGKGEREVRYETLVQRILRREDAAYRRVVCLSALFPKPEDMKDLVEWIRQDDEGEPVHSNWRPTRQRFGTIESNAYGGGRLEITLGEEQPFVPRFVGRVEAPSTQKRTRPFPQGNHELTIATAWRFIAQGKKVLVYCSMKKSVEKFGAEILDLLQRGFIEPLVEDSQRLKNARSVGSEWLGESHPAVRCLEFGVALHHGGLPRQYLNEVEELLKAGECPLTVASPTLAQGLNLAASVLLVPSIWRGGEIIPTSEFANVAGRAGRAFVDLEGLILHVVWDEKPKRKRAWNVLVAKAKAPLLQSGILLLAIQILKRIASSNDVPIIEVVDYITGNSSAWDFAEIQGEKNPLSLGDWERDMASLDAALLGMIELDCDTEQIPASLKTALEGSLFSRQAGKMKKGNEDVILDFLAARASEIWAKTDVAQRKGFYHAGIGLKTGLLVSEHIEMLLGCLYHAEKAMEVAEYSKAEDLIIKFAEIVFQFAPFQPFKSLPDKWQEGLRMWLSGISSAEVIKTCGKEGVDFLQDGIGYRLPWAMEAVRVHCVAVGRIEEDDLSGEVAIAAETGSLSKPMMTMLRNGLNSREAAKCAFESTSVTFDSFGGMVEWLDSEEVIELSQREKWPSVTSRYSWLKFFERKQRAAVKGWTRKRFRVDLDWLDESVNEGDNLVLEKSQKFVGGFLVLTPDYREVGKTRCRFDTKSLARVTVEVGRAGLILDYFGVTIQVVHQLFQFL